MANVGRFVWFGVCCFVFRYKNEEVPTRGRQVGIVGEVCESFTLDMGNSVRGC